MKRIGLWVVGATLLLSSCDTYTGQGAAVGGTFGSILGSAIGGIAGGWRGSDIGTIVGMAGGAAVGAAIGAQADKAEAEKYAAYKRDRERRRAERENQYGDDYEPRGNYDNSGFDGTNSGDDRIDIGISGPEGQQPKEQDPAKRAGEIKQNVLQHGGPPGEQLDRLVRRSRRQRAEGAEAHAFEGPAPVEKKQSRKLQPKQGKLPEMSELSDHMLIRLLQRQIFHNRRQPFRNPAAELG
jgi:hypothetical protein